MQNKRLPIPNQQSCTELTLYVGGVQRGIRSRSLEKTYTEENVSKLFMKEVLFINFEIIIIFLKKLFSFENRPILFHFLYSQNYSHIGFNFSI